MIFFNNWIKIDYDLAIILITLAYVIGFLTPFIFCLLHDRKIKNRRYNKPVGREQNINTDFRLHRL